MEVTDRLCSLGKSMGVLCRDIIALMRNILIIKTCKNAPDILSIPEDQFVKLAKTAEGVAGERVLRAWRFFRMPKTLCAIPRIRAYCLKRQR